MLLCPNSSMSKHRSSAKTLIITDDDETAVDERAGNELNPFSFKEFLRSKNQEDSSPSLWTAEEEQESVSSSSCGGKEEQGDSASLWLQQEQTWRSTAAENYEGEEFSTSDLVTSCRRTQLQQDNESLRRTIRTLEAESESSQLRVRELEEELRRRRSEEEKEVQALSSMVQNVEENLLLMTKRAVKAESSVSRLKGELLQLQGQLDITRLDNERLRGESVSMATMRHNAQLAAEYLDKATGHAHTSIRQLLGETGNLRLVSHLLRSIDKISDVS